MADFNIRFYSNSMNRKYTFKMYIPNDIDPREKENSPYWNRATRVLFLLHGYTCDADNWVSEELSKKYNFAVVCPNGENSFWLDAKAAGHQYCTLVGKELVEYIRNTFGLGMKKEDTCILGFSMGGFGALHTGFAYPDTFGKIGAMSSALIIHDVAAKTYLDGKAVANPEYYIEWFGDPDKVLQSKNNPETLVKELKMDGRKIPGIYMCCGTEDFLLENNRNFHDFLNNEKVEHIYKESKGNHDMIFWNEYTEKIIQWMFGDML